MSIKQKQIEFLERFIAGDMGVIRRCSSGICRNIYEFSGEYIDMSLYKSITAEWLREQGKDYDTSMPIGGEDIYRSSIPKYEGEQLRLRISLAKHLLEGLSDD